MKGINPRLERNWTEFAVRELDAIGAVLLEGFLDADRIAAYLAAVYRVQDKTMAAVGRDRFDAALSAGYNELRAPFLFEPVFFDLLEDDRVLGLVDRVLGPHAVLRFCNCMMSAPVAQSSGRLNTYQYHQNFKFYLEGADSKAVFLEFAIALSTPAQPFKVVPGSHHQSECPSDESIATTATTIDWKAGDLLLMTPFLWHREEENHTGADTVSLFLQFSRPFIKPHADYMRALPPARLEQLPERTRKLLGAHSQLPVSIADFYAPPEQRPYRPGQW